MEGLRVNGCDGGEKPMSAVASYFSGFSSASLLDQRKSSQGWLGKVAPNINISVVETLACALHNHSAGEVLRHFGSRGPSCPPQGKAPSNTGVHMQTRRKGILFVCEDATMLEVRPMLLERAG